MTRKEDQDDLATKFEELRVLRSQDRESEARQKELKEDLVPVIQDLGQFYFIDSEGRKRYAYYGDADIRYIDVEELEAAIDEGVVAADVLEEVAPRKVDLDAFDTAMKAGRIPPSVVRRMLKIQKGRQTVKYSDAVGGD